jgi:hypothetical protein
MRTLTRVSIFLSVLLVLGDAPSWGDSENIPLPKTEPAPSQENDNKLLQSCLSYALDQHPGPTSGRHPRETTPLDLKGAVLPPNLITETEVVGDVPSPIRMYRGRWALRLTNTSYIPYAAFVERLTPTEMTIALVMRPEEGHKLDPTNGFRHKLEWTGNAFVGRDVNLWGGKATTVMIGISQFADVMILATKNSTGTQLLGCLFSEQP